ncbi:MAG: hydantoinase/oxoprolinase family protein [Bradyrhizobiaceae bacterium]|nr:hydantoinase/oxoprolinase family protein [Bradyrhizobiaceae bacterium]
MSNATARQERQESGLHVGVDVGGTFTDTIAIRADGSVRMSKVPTTPGDQSAGFLNGLAQAQIDLPEIAWLVHGTTVGTNATLERNGAKCGLITTRGFRDVLELGRRERPQLFGMYGQYRPIVPRDLRLEVAERIDARGNILVPLDVDELVAAIDKLKERGVTSLLICFLNSHANPEHENRAAKIAADLWPTSYVTQSAEILAEFREVERFGTAAVNAYIRPLIDRYIRGLADRLKAGGMPNELAIMQANGGIMSAPLACEKSVNTVLSGPAAGVIAATYISEQSGHKQVVTCDMGGTSFDVGLIVDGVPLVTSDRDLDFNLPMRIPIIDIHTIGAGGGSIARINEAGMLEVGPRSAGAAPGPIAYGRGGTEPTVTDANVLLGRLSSEQLLAVTKKIDLPAIRAAFERLGAPLSLSAENAAASVLRIVNDAMAGAIRFVTLQRGRDPREFAIFAFGGAGPLHGAALARELQVPTVIVPYVPGLTCALGCIVANVRHDYVQTIGKALEDVREVELRDVLLQQRKAGIDLLATEHVPTQSVTVHHQADMHYEGQRYTLRVTVDPARVSIDSLQEQLRAACHEAFGIDLSNFRPKIANLRTAVIGVRPRIDLKRIIAATHRPKKSVSDARIGKRDVWFGDSFVPTPVYQRELIPIGAEIQGPAIVNQMDSTTVVDQSNRVSVSELGNLMIQVNA